MQVTANTRTHEMSWDNILGRIQTRRFGHANGTQQQATPDRSRVPPSAAPESRRFKSKPQLDGKRVTRRLD